jgi:secondary thiamine-phosphate synthase enzyme
MQKAQKKVNKIMEQQQITITTNGRKAINITDEINRVIGQSNIKTGLCHIFVQHTSASLMITEAADPDVKSDIEDFFQKTVLDGDLNYRHNNEGDFDMSGHIRSVLTGSSQTIPIINNELGFGIWQGLFLYEHRDGTFNRNLIITCQ